MIDVKSLIEAQLASTNLEILVFGPAIHPPSTDPHTAALQTKRSDIKATLLASGFSAAFGEDVVDSSLPAHVADPLLQEVVAMQKADFIVVLVHSPGSLVEAKTITANESLCRKTAFFCFEEHSAGLAVQHIQAVSQRLGASCRLISLAEVQACHLTSAVLEKVRAVQVAKAFLF